MGFNGGRQHRLALGIFGWRRRTLRTFVLRRRLTRVLGLQTAAIAFVRRHVHPEHINPTIEVPCLPLSSSTADIRDPERYQDFIRGSSLRSPLVPATSSAAVRTKSTKVIIPRRIVLIEFPSVQTWESFYNGPVYQGAQRRCVTNAALPASYASRVWPSDDG